MKLLGVPKDLLERDTAVSESVACAMAGGARERTGADFALSVTGLAGPGGGSEEIPTGTVWIGYADNQGSEAKRFYFLGDRGRVRTMATQSALNLLRLNLLLR
ncbi:MAG: CinA family protein [Bryobacteraceae bacterium]